MADASGAIGAGDLDAVITGLRILIGIDLQRDGRVGPVVDAEVQLLAGMADLQLTGLLAQMQALHVHTGLVGWQGGDDIGVAQLGVFIQFEQRGFGTPVDHALVMAAAVLLLRLFDIARLQEQRVGVGIGFVEFVLHMTQRADRLLIGIQQSFDARSLVTIQG